MFCENKLCRCHVQCKAEDNMLSYIEANGKRVDVRRIIVFADIGKKDEQKFTFCEICANVLAITNRVALQYDHENPPTAG